MCVNGQRRSTFFFDCFMAFKHLINYTADEKKVVSLHGIIKYH